MGGEKMEVLKITIKLNQKQKDKFIQKYIREELGEKGEIKDNEMGIYLKSKILNYIEEINFKEKIEEIEKRIKELNNTHKYFYLRDLFSKEEWEAMKDYKLLLRKNIFS